jgi:hypothetical protein
MRDILKPNGPDEPARLPGAGRDRFPQGSMPMEDRYSTLQKALDDTDARKALLRQRMQKLQDMSNHACMAAKYFYEGDFAMCDKEMAKQHAILKEFRRDTVMTGLELFAGNMLPGAIIFSLLLSTASSLRIAIPASMIIAAGMINVALFALHTYRQISTASPYFLDSLAHRVEDQLADLRMEARDILREMRKTEKSRD